MYSDFFYAILLIAIPLGIFFLFSWAILYHVLKYGFKKSDNQKIALVFSIVMLAISLCIVQKFFAVDWDKATMKDFLRKSNINIFTNPYGR